MITIKPCGDQLDELVSFVSRLNSKGDHHIGFFGEGEADVRASLAECIIPPVEGFRMAYEDGRLVGIFGVDADREIDRAWLFGPLVEHVNWHEVADLLFPSFQRAPRCSGARCCSAASTSAWGSCGSAPMRDS